MGPVTVLPVRGEVFLDARDDGRALRLSWHHEHDCVVVSIWREDHCAATIQVRRDDVPRLIASLVDGLADPAPQATGKPEAV